MGFLHTGLLWLFLPLAAIPIILHLLTLHRLQIVELSTFRFLFDSYVQQRRRMKFLEALIAMLRTAFLLFLIFTICRPVVKHWDALFGGGGSGRDVVMLFDASASMRAKSEGQTAMQRAKQAAGKVVDRLGSEDRVTIIRVGAKAEEICNRFSSDTKAIATEIEQIDASPSRANLFAAFSHLFGVGSQNLNKPLIYLFSDLQATGWREFEDGQSSTLLPEGTELIVVDVGAGRPPSNVALVGGAPESQRAIAGLPLALRPQVKNFSASETADVSVSILIDEKEIARKTLTLKPGEQGTAEVIHTPRQAGVVRGRYEIDADDFQDDDTYLFTLDVAPRVKVVLVNGNPVAEPLENEGLYLRTAVVATDAKPDKVIELDDADADDKKPKADPQLAAQQEFVRSLDVIDLPEASLTEDSLKDVDAVILANCGKLTPPQFNLLCEYVANGGGLMILPGDKVNHDTYNKQLFTAPTRPEETLVAAQLGPPVGDPAQSDSFLRMGAIDLAHPILSVFADSEQKYLAKVNVYRRFPLVFPENSGDARLAEFADGEPALIESRLGRGRVLLSAFPFNTKWSNLPMKPEFVPLVLRMISYAKRPAALQGPSVVQPGGAAEFTVSQLWAPASAKVTDVSGRVSPISLQRSNSQLMGAYDRTMEKGFYTVEVSGRRPEQLINGAMSFAVNVHAAESDFASHNGARLEKLLPTAKVTLVDASAQAQQSYGSVGNEREIWRPLIFLLFAIIGVEFMLSTLGGQVADGEETPSTAERIRNLAAGDWVGRLADVDDRESVGSGTN